MATVVLVAGYWACLAAGWLPPLGGTSPEAGLPDGIRAEAVRRMAQALPFWPKPGKRGGFLGTGCMTPTGRA